MHMNGVDDLRTVERLRAAQHGVLTLGDLRTALAEPHRAALHRRLDRLIRAGVLRRFSSGFYVAEEFELAVLSQRIAADSAVSFETVLARDLVIGPRPARALSAIRDGRSATFAAHGCRIEYHHLAASLRFGESVREGIRTTDAEKALLDVLNFHLRGRRALFDVHSDLNFDRLDRGKLRDYLERYRNPRFVAFARDTLGLR